MAKGFFLLSHWIKPPVGTHTFGVRLMTLTTLAALSGNRSGWAIPGDLRC